MGSLAEITIFSLHARKVVTTGEGGMIVTNDRALAERLRRLRHQGMSLSDFARHGASPDRVRELSGDRLQFPHHRYPGRRSGSPSSIGWTICSRAAARSPNAISERSPATRYSFHRTCPPSSRRIGKAIRSRFARARR